VLGDIEAANDANLQCDDERMTQLSPLPKGHPVAEIILPLIAGDGKAQPFPSGTAVFIAPGLALAATHVLDDYWTRFAEPRAWEESASAGFVIQTHQFQKQLDAFVPWQVFRACHSEHTDVAILQLAPRGQLPKNYRWPYPRIDLAPPTVGEELVVVGFPEPTIVWDPTDSEWSIKAPPHVSVGRVTQVFSERRDSVRLPFPSFELETSVLGGMSGGPIFDRSGHLRGLVCSSFEMDETVASSPIMYGTMLWPAVALPVAPTPNLGQSETSTLLDLIVAGRVDALNHERLRLFGDGNAPSRLGDNVT
jgi:Trypsin-like peptidase domain